MKLRIVEFANGKYGIQKKILFFWALMDVHNMEVDTRFFTVYGTVEEAQEEIERLLSKPYSILSHSKTYKG